MFPHPLLIPLVNPTTSLPCFSSFITGDFPPSVRHTYSVDFSRHWKTRSYSGISPRLCYLRVGVRGGNRLETNDGREPVWTTFGLLSLRTTSGLSSRRVPYLVSSLPLSYLNHTFYLLKVGLYYIVFYKFCMTLSFIRLRDYEGNDVL